MDDAAPVRIVERGGESDQQARRRFGRQRSIGLTPGRQVVGQGQACDQFHHDVRTVLDQVEVKDLYNVGVPQRRDSLRFRAKTVEREFVFGQVAVQDFDGNRPVEGEMLAEIDLGHAAVPQALADFNFRQDAPDPVGHHDSRDPCAVHSIAPVTES